MRLYLIFALFFLLVSTVVNAQVLSGRFEQGDDEKVIRSSRGVVNTFGFQPNLGQVGDFEGRKVKDVLFFTRHSGIDLYVKEDGISYVIRDVRRAKSDRVFREMLLHRDMKEPREVSSHGKEVEQETMIWARVDLRVVGGSVRGDRIEYEEPIEGYTNYYLAHCPEGVLFVPSYRVVRIKEVYPGVDWVWRIGEDGFLHHEFEVGVGVDVSKIKLEVKWADVKLSDDGKRLRLSTPVGEIEDGNVVGYDDMGMVDVKYINLGDGIISFNVKGGYRGKLTIDPPLSRLWATYYGGSSDDYGYSITTDGSGNVLVTGETYSTNFPTYNPGGSAYYDSTWNGIWDVFILKFSNTGVRQWATYYGGSNYDRGRFITTDAQGNIFVTGYTNSTDFPTYNPGGDVYFDGTHNGDYDVFILKFNGNGVRLWATYFGGSDKDYGHSIATDAQGNLFVAGFTFSTDFPTNNPGGGAYFDNTHNGSFDAFIAKFSNSGVLQWATYFGGSSGEEFLDITLDPSGNVFVVGYAYSTDFPTYNPGGVYFQGNFGGGVRDAVLLKFNNSGVLQWSTYYGGNGDEEGWSIVSDANGNVFVTGYTSSTNFPTQDPGGGAYYQTYNAGNDAFILKFNNSCVRQWATYFGGSGDEYGFYVSEKSSIAIDANGNVFITGYTTSTNLPTQDPGGGAYYQANNAGDKDVFIAKFDKNGVLKWSTYYGGSDDDRSHSIATDLSGNVFVTGRTYSSNFPIYNPGGAYYQGSKSGGYDIFILKFEGEGATGVENETRGIPKTFVVYQNYPNPFNPTTQITFDLPEDGNVKVEVFNLLGEKVATLYGGFMEAGFGKRVRWNAVGFSSGVYFYRVSLEGKYVGVKKMVLMK